MDEFSSRKWIKRKQTISKLLQKKRHRILQKCIFSSRTGSCLANNSRAWALFTRILSLCPFLMLSDFIISSSRLVESSHWMAENHFFPHTLMFLLLRTYKHQIYYKWTFRICKQLHGNDIYSFYWGLFAFQRPCDLRKVKYVRKLCNPQISPLMIWESVII